MVEAGTVPSAADSEITICGLFDRLMQNPLMSTANFSFSIHTSKVQVARKA
jgi:hypothetical protein